MPRWLAKMGGRMDMLNDDELLAIVDAENRVIGSGARGDIHRRQLRHRSAHILLVNTAGNIFVQRRAEHKDCAPGLWDTSAAGHVDVGESYDAAARRELAEELAVEGVALKPLWDLPARVATGNEFARVYLCRTDIEPEPDAAEIADACWYTRQQLAASIAGDPERYTTVFRDIFTRFHHAESVDV